MAINLRTLQTALNELPKLSPKAVVAELSQLLGRKTVAYLAGVNSVREVASWLDNTEPRPDRLAILRSSLQAARLIAMLESPESASAWFVGTNTLFNFETPADVLRERGTDARTDVLRAAQAFVAEAYEAVKEEAVLPA